MHTRIFLVTLVIPLLLSACTSVHYTGDGRVTRISSSNEAIVLHPTHHEEVELKTVNGRIAVGKGYSLGNVRTVNGRIQLGPETSAKDVRTVNGRIRIEPDSSTHNLKSVNGGIRVHASKVIGNVRTTNGSITLDQGTVVDGSVITTNGRISLSDVTVMENLKMSHGKITIDNTTVEGDIQIDERSIWSWLSFNWRDPKVIIGPNSVVKGEIIAYGDIRLYIHDTARVGGIEGAEAQYYSGDYP